MKRYRCAVAMTVLCFASPTLFADVYDLTTDWSEAANPNGVWSYNEGNNPLPHVEWWQRNLGGWTSAQPGWAKSEDGTNRIPFWYRSNGSETFGLDRVAGDIIVHSRDDGNGQGNGEGNVTWTSPSAATVDITGAVWLGRDIGRGNNWYLYHNDLLLTSGRVESGDVYSRANPLDLANGGGGPTALHLPVCEGDKISLKFVARSGSFGEFSGVKLKITTSPLPSGAPVLINARSRRAHGAAGEFDLNLPIAGPSAVECRADGPRQILLTFNQPIKAVDGALGANEIELSSGTLGDVALTCSQVLINLSGVPDRQCLTIKLQGLAGLSDIPVAPIEFDIRVLLGDVTGNGGVNLIDMQGIKTLLFAPLNYSSFLRDVNLTGTINLVDLQAGKGNLFQSASCP